MHRWIGCSWGHQQRWVLWFQLLVRNGWHWWHRFHWIHKWWMLLWVRTSVHQFWNRWYSLASYIHTYITNVHTTGSSSNRRRSYCWYNSRSKFIDWYFLLDVSNIRFCLNWPNIWYWLHNTIRFWVQDEVNKEYIRYWWRDILNYSQYRTMWR